MKQRDFLLEDEILSPIVAKYTGECLLGKGDLFSTFVNSIVGQQDFSYCSGGNLE